MRRAALLCFSERGKSLAERVKALLESEYDVGLYEKADGKAHMPELFGSCDALVFIGACGIAVRFIAPYVTSKTGDPAVIVIDERGLHAISLLSGHIGGANALTGRIADAIGADPVITTATDVNGRFSVDTWAKTHGASIGSMALAKRFSAEILTRDLPICSDFPLPEKLPAGLTAADSGAFGAYIGVKDIRPFDETLRLVPRIVCLGIGCKKDTPEEKIEALFRESGIAPESVCAVASIDVKKDEPGLLAFARTHGFETRFYPAETLMSVPGNFTASAFVKKTVGADNVCERSALCRAGEDGQLILKKTAKDGVTIAAAVKKWSVSFE